MLRPQATLVVDYTWSLVVESEITPHLLTMSCLTTNVTPQHRHLPTGTLTKKLLFKANADLSHVSITTRLVRYIIFLKNTFKIFGFWLMTYSLISSRSHVFPAKLPNQAPHQPPGHRLLDFCWNTRCISEIP